MTTATTIQVDYGTDLTGGDCSGVLFEIPTTEVIGGDVIDIRLWGMSFDMLAPYALYLGTVSMGAGVNTVMPLDDIVEYAGFNNSNISVLDWSVSSLISVTAVTDIIWDNNGVPETYALAGTDITVGFNFSENVLYEVNDNLLTGSVQVVYRSSQDVQEIVDFAEKHDHQCEWPILNIGRVTAVNELINIEDATGTLLSWAAPGENITDRVARKGYSCIEIIDGTDLYGSVKLEYTRTPYYKLWQWEVPVGAEGQYWFFIYRDGIPVNKFAIQMPDLTSGVPEPRNIAIRVVARDGGGALDNVSVYIDGLFRGITDADGIINIDGIMTGSHSLKLTRDGFVDSDLDNLYNDELMVY